MISNYNSLKDWEKKMKLNNNTENDRLKSKEFTVVQFKKE